jgi:GNAT superfamily N-acetyltransferase
VVVELLENVLVGVLVTIASVAVVRVRRRIRDRRLERRYPVAGDYCTVFEDEVDGDPVMVKATSSFEQHGLRLTGTTTNLEDRRSWRLEASIVPGNGRIHGTYIADDPNDPGMGGFFLEITPDGGLDGAWAGFDSENKQVTSGRYRFWPTTNIAVRPMQPEDLPVALAILGAALGQRYVTLDELSQHLGDQSDRFAVVAVMPDGNVVGAATAGVTTSTVFLEKSVPSAMRARLQKALPHLDYHQVGVLKSVAVAGNSRGAGAGTELSQAVIDELWRRGATCVVAIGWTDHQGCHIEGTLASLGFLTLASLPDFWREESTEKGYACPTCGTPCTCEARVFFLLRGDATMSAGDRTLVTLPGGG